MTHRAYRKTSINSRLAALLSAGLLLLYSCSIRADESLLVRTDTKSFAVVELFTSEGCSSCPPADRLLSKIAEEARDRNLPVYTLAFHVDYWNYIGWTDPYSEKSYSLRQRQYARALHSTQVYTPQMIVNGAKEFVGSNTDDAKTSISEALGGSAGIKIAARVDPPIVQKLQVEYQTDALPPEAVVNIVLVERELFQDVSRGENAGKKLRHDNVVRAFRQSIQGKACLTLEIPEDLRPEKSSIVIFVQDGKTMKILGAASADVIQGVGP